jgi:hypothetical protein
MAHFITLTPNPITFQLADQLEACQPLWTVVDVSRYDILDLELGVLFLTSGSTVHVCIETSMQNQVDSRIARGSEQGWLVAGEFRPVSSDKGEIPHPQWQKLNISSGLNGNGILKFIRWRVRLTQPGTVTFFIRGLTRRWGR